jgi:hypothetical protein
MEKTDQKILQTFGNSNPFTVPEGYFENFASDINAQIADEQVTFKKLIKPWMYLAAIFVGVFLLANVFYAIYQQNKSRNAELYEMYLMSQLDQTIMYDYYALSMTDDETNNNHQN